MCRLSSGCLTCSSDLTTLLQPAICKALALVDCRWGLRVEGGSRGGGGIGGITLSASLTGLILPYSVSIHPLIRAVQVSCVSGAYPFPLFPTAPPSVISLSLTGGASMAPCTAYTVATFNLSAQVGASHRGELIWGREVKVGTSRIADAQGGPQQHCTLQI